MARRENVSAPGIGVADGFPLAFWYKLQQPGDFPAGQLSGLERDRKPPVTWCHNRGRL